MKYKVRRSVGVPADVAAAELERIHAKNDGLRPKEVVHEARPDEAPLHPVFEWNNEVCGENWREHQARNLIRSVALVVDEQDENSAARSVYVHVGDVYRPVSEVVQSPDMFATALAELNGKMNSARRALDDLESAAKGTGDGERMARIALAMRAVDAAASAVQAIH